MAQIDLNNDLEVLFGTIVGEGESEPIIGKYAIASSIMNRVAQHKIHPHFGDGTVRGACLFPAQYDCWNAGANRNRVMAIDLTKLNPEQVDCMNIAKMAMTGNLVDVTSGATYYYAPIIAGPAWLYGASFCGLFGTQLFWKNVR